jgi:hypothetical protein
MFIRKRIRGLAAALVAAVALSSSPAHAAGTDQGLLITQVTGSKWQVRLIAGAKGPLRFSGTFTATSGVNSFSKIRLEAGDVVRITPDRSLEVSFDAAAGTFDGAYFWTPQTSQICLRDTGGTGTRVYVGTTLADAAEASFPLELQGENPCGLKPPPGPYQTTRKFHPGHYTALLRGQGGLKYMNDAVRPGVVGIMKRYTWRRLEPTPGTYDFSGIQSDLAWASSYGMQLIVMIEDKTFQDERPTPAYLDGYTFRNRIGGYTVLRWNPYVVARWKALVKAMGARFDAHPNFEGIATQETAMGFDGSQLAAHGYSPELYRDAYIQMFESALASLPTSRIFWYQNFFTGNQSYIAAIARAVGPKGVVMGGPDVLPDDQPLLTKSYPYYSQYLGRMHLFAQVEGICYRAPHETAGYSTRYWTMDELFGFARDQLHVNYMIWVRVPKSTPADSYNWYDALPTIVANPTFNEEW